MLGSLLDAGQIDEVHVFIAPKLIGGAAPQSRSAARHRADGQGTCILRRNASKSVGDDVYIHGRRRAVVDRPDQARRAVPLAQVRARVAARNRGPRRQRARLFEAIQMRVAAQIDRTCRRRPARPACGRRGGSWRAARTSRPGAMTYIVRVFVENEDLAVGQGGRSREVAAQAAVATALCPSWRRHRSALPSR